MRPPPTKENGTNCTAELTVIAAATPPPMSSLEAALVAAVFVVTRLDAAVTAAFPMVGRSTLTLFEEIAA